MRNLLKVLKVDLYKATFSITFIVSILGVSSIYFIVAKPEISSSSIDILYIFRNSIEWIGTYHLMVILMCTLPFSGIFCKEWVSNNIRYSIIRGGISNYSWSKFIVCSLAGGLTILIGTILFIVIMLNYMPIVNNFRIEENYYYYTMANELLNNGDEITYLTIYLVLRFLYGAFWASTGILASTYIPNIYISLCTPFILSYVYRIISFKLPKYFRLEHIANGTMGNFINDNMVLTVTYSILLFVFLILILGKVFANKIRWRMENE